MPGGPEQTSPDRDRASRASTGPADGAGGISADRTEPTGDTKAEHTKAEHTKAEHTKAEHTKAEHTKAEHTDADRASRSSSDRGSPASRISARPTDGAGRISAGRAEPTSVTKAEQADRGDADRGSRTKTDRAGRANAEVAERAGDGQAEPGDRYKWVALTNTTAAVFMSALDGSIVIIALPAIFRGIHLDPLAPGNVFYLLWMIMGYRLVQAVLVVTVGRLGDMFGRVKIYNAGFAVFTVASILLSFDPFRGGHGALWLIGWRVLQAIGGSMLTANSAAILTDAFPSDQRGFALGTNQVAAIAGQFIGLVAGGVLAAIDWRAVFWVNVPVGVFGTLWAYRKLREVGERHSGRIDWWGNATFSVGLSAILIGITVGIQPYHGHAMGWTNPAVLGMIIGGVALLAAFVVIERAITDPMFQLALFRIRAFTAGNIAGLVTAIARGGLQFMLIIWLQGIWLPLHGYSYTQAPFWAGIFLLPLTAGILIAGPTSGLLSDRFGSRGIASAGMVVFGGSFIGLSLLPVDFPYWLFATLIAANGIGAGMFAAPNSSSIMGSVPASQRGAASGMRSTFQNSGTALSIGVFFSLMIAGLASTLPHTLTSGLQRQGVSHAVAYQIGTLPPVSSLFAAVLGVNPIKHLLALKGALQTLAPGSRRTLTGARFFPDLISAPFHHGLIVVFIVATVLAGIAGVASLLRGGRYQAQPTMEQATPREVAKK
jgi:MFS family permease